VQKALQPSWEKSWNLRIKAHTRGSAEKRPTESPSSPTWLKAHLDLAAGMGRAWSPKETPTAAREYPYLSKSVVEVSACSLESRRRMWAWLLQTVAESSPCSKAN
jgi:hypothetical protein